MVAISEIKSTVDITAANCLMLLSRVGQENNNNVGGDQKRVFTCKTCLKEFHSFQALGGHRASHKKPNNGDNPTAGLMKKAKTTSHPCPICGVEFPMGQALGGHMRRHRNENGGSALVTRELLLLPAPEPTVTTLKKSSSGKRIACLDLGLGMTENLNLKLELGRTVY